MSSDRPVLISSPGAGLGHLVRACAVALRLNEREISARIVTNSPFAQGLARLTGLDIDAIPKRRWRQDLPDYVGSIRPRLIVLDVFPWGLDNEWPAAAPASTPFVLLARRLKVDEYLRAVGREWDPASPTLERVAVLEPLADEHLARFADSDILQLPGRVRLPNSVTGPPIPADLERLLDGGRLRLVVHSGPAGEIEKLIALAREDAEPDGGETALISPWPDLKASCPIFEHFPAGRLLERAARIIGGGGYNLVAETDGFSDKRLLLPFDRKFDDQDGRLAGTAAGGADGGPALADWLVGLL